MINTGGKVLKKASIVLFGLIALAGCATNKDSLPEPKPIIKTIAVIPVSDPLTFTLKNRNAMEFLVSPLIGVGTALDSHQKTKLFTEKIKAENHQLGQNLTRVVVEALNRQGYKASILPGLQRLPDDPDNIEYAKIKTDADAILHVYFRDIGVFSGYGSLDYLPRVNIRGYLFPPKEEEEFYTEDIYYGVDSREGASWGIPGDPKFAYRSFDDLINKVPEVVTGFNIGAQAAGERLVQEMKNSLR